MILIFDIKDGCGILLILPKLGIIPVVITAQKSKIVENCCKELNIEELYQGSGNKLETFISCKKAGAIRECINYLVQYERGLDIQSKIESTISLLLAKEYEEKTCGELSNGVAYTIQEYVTKEEKDCVIETHRNHVDIQYIVEGEERLFIYEAHSLISLGEYDSEKDVELWKNGLVTAENLLCQGSMIVIYNNKAHMGGVISTVPNRVKKVVCKVEI